jgi:HEPN domain-containing protein
MSTKYLHLLPRPLLDDLLQGRWIPVIGAGLSRNAVLPKGSRVPLWQELGQAFANEMKGYPFRDPIDAISAYDHEFRRVKLAEKLSEFLFVDRAKPGRVHEALCRLGFDIVCTTNIDFLLERGYDGIGRPCRPVVYDDQLSMGDRREPGSDGPKVTLLKLHGDVNNPKALVITEEDYESFLNRHAIKATYIANLLICRTAVLVGYSLDDPDFRQIWRVISDRLGELRRPAYSLAVGASPSDIARFERRDVTVVNLHRSVRRYEEVLTTLFIELRDYQREKLQIKSGGAEKDAVEQLALPATATTRICLFEVPDNWLSFYQSNIFPIAKNWGFVPLTASSVLAPGEAVFAKIDALIQRAEMIVADISNPKALPELLATIGKRNPKHLLVVLEDTPELRDEMGLLREHLSNVAFVRRPTSLLGDTEEFVKLVGDWFQMISGDTLERLAEEPYRLLEKKEYRAAVISAVSLLETRLRERLQQSQADIRKMYSLGQLLMQAIEQGLISSRERLALNDIIQARNVAVHTQGAISAKTCREVVETVRRILQGIPNHQAG